MKINHVHITFLLSPLNMALLHSAPIAPTIPDITHFHLLVMKAKALGYRNSQIPETMTNNWVNCRFLGTIWNVLSMKSLLAAFIMVRPSFETNKEYPTLTSVWRKNGSLSNVALYGAGIAARLCIPLGFDGLMDIVQHASLRFIWHGGQPWVFQLHKVPHSPDYGAIKKPTR